MNKYIIENTTNILEAQNSGAYLDETFWPTWENDLENFKNALVRYQSEGTPFTLLRISHSEFIALEAGTSQIPQSGNFQGRHSKNNTLSNELLVKFLKSIDSSDQLSTQIGWDFLESAGRVANIMETYRRDHGATEWPNLTKHTKLKQVVDLPMDIIYGLCANRWFFRTFKNKIGLMGAGPKIEAIRELMKHKEYQEYLGCDLFTDYVSLPQRQALDDPSLEDVVREGVSKSTCDVFLIGCGVSKLKFWHLLKDTKNCIFLDIGHGIDLIAGHGDQRRPYCGSWTNYKIGTTETFGQVDEMGPQWGRGEYKIL